MKTLHECISRWLQDYSFSNFKSGYLDPLFHFVFNDDIALVLGICVTCGILMSAVAVLAGVAVFATFSMVETGTISPVVFVLQLWGGFFSIGLAFSPFVLYILFVKSGIAWYSYSLVASIVGWFSFIFIEVPINFFFEQSHSLSNLESREFLSRNLDSLAKDQKTSLGFEDIVISEEEKPNLSSGASAFSYLVFCGVVVYNLYKICVG
jgi:hypothetical protein